MQSIFDPAKTKSVFKLATTKNFHSFLYIVGPWHSQVWFSHWSANLWFQITAVLLIFSPFSNTSQLTVRTTFSEHLHSGVFGFQLLWLCPPRDSAHNGTPPTMGLRPQRGPIPDSLGHPDPCPTAIPNFLSGTQGQLETGSDFSKYAKKMKRKKTPSPTFYLSLLLMRILWQSFHLTPVNQEKILKTVCPLRGTFCLTQTRCLSASGSFFFFFFCPRKRCSNPPWGNLSIGVLLLIWWERISHS